MCVYIYIGIHDVYIYIHRYSLCFFLCLFVVLLLARDPYGSLIIQGAKEKGAPGLRDLGNLEVG